jgi:hypothetical protein
LYEKEKEKGTAVDSAPKPSRPGQILKGNNKK